MSGFVGSRARKKRRNIFLTLGFLIIIGLIYFIFPTFQFNLNDPVPDENLIPDPTEDLTSLASDIEDLELTVFQKDQKIKFRDGQIKNLEIQLKDTKTQLENTIKELHDVLKKMKFSRFEIILIDDGSTDNTKKITKKLNIKVISNPENIGYGFSLKRGITKAKFETVWIIDADQTYPIEEFPRLYEQKFIRNIFFS